MARSQRVLSGSLTKGSTATPSGSIIFLYQGINAKTDESYFGSLLPRIGSGDRLALYRFGKRLPEKTFDDSITMNSDPADIRGEGDDPISTRIDFRYESRNLGQLDQRPEGYSFIETREYDAVGYLQDPGTTMWPVNLFNSSLLPKYEYDGVIEPLDIRAEMLGILDTRYEGYSVRGSLMGAVGEGPLGSRQIKDAWLKYNPPPPWFLDAPDSFGHDRIASSSPWVPNEGVMPLQAYQNLDQVEDYPFVERDYRNEVYAEVTSHNPGRFIPVSTPMNWNYALTSSFQSANETDSFGRHQYLSPGSLVIWHRYERAVPSTTTNPGAGGFLDSSINNYTGSLYTNDAPTLDTTEYPSSYIGTGSWSFDGNDTCVYIGGKHGNLVQQFGDIFIQESYFHKSWTLSFWIKQDALTFANPQNLFQIGSDYLSRDYLNGWTVEGKIYIKNYGNTGGNYSTQYSVAKDLWLADTWTHLVFQQIQGNGIPYSGTGVVWRMYVNGTEVSSTIVKGGSGKETRFNGIDGGNFIVIGARSSGFDDGSRVSDFAGTIAEFAAWNTILSQDEISALYDVTTAGIKTVVPVSTTYTLKQISNVKPAWRSVYGDHEYDLSADLVGWWRFSNTDKLNSPALSDASGKGNNGSSGNVATWVTSAGQSNYVSEGSYIADFNGAGNQYYILSPTPTWVSVIGITATVYKAFTIAVWLKVDSYANNEVIWWFGDTTDGKYLTMLFDSSGNIKIKWATGGHVLAGNSSASINDGDWHHVTLVQLGMTSADEDDSTPDQVNKTSRFRLYIDGELQTWTAGDFTTAFGNLAYEGLFVGGSAAGSDFYDGKLMELSVWSNPGMRPINQEMVKALYQASISGVRQYTLGGTVYSSIVTEQNNDMNNALQLLNSASYRNSSDPLETRANHGFYFGQKAGSITYGDI